MNWFILGCFLVLTVLSLVASVYFFAYFCHPDQKDFSWATSFQKLVVVSGFSVGCLQCFIIPLDVENER